MSTSVPVSAPEAPKPTDPVGPTAYVDQSRDLHQEKVKEMETERSKAKSAVPRFQARKVTSLTRPSAPDPIYETLIFRAAANNPLANLNYPSVSYFYPNFAPLFYLLNYMDFLMASTKRWLDNSMGWAPPYSQMYIAVLLYVQTFRAMDAAGYAFPGGEIANFLQTFDSVFPLNELWIPGPLVAAFRNLSAFWPSQSDRFGNVTPSVPQYPGWSTARRFVPLNSIVDIFPNISVFISRLRTICATAATANLTESEFQNHVNGPAFMANLFGRQLTNDAQDRLIVTSPGSNYVYPGSLELWRNANSRLNFLKVPSDLTTTTTAINNWSGFMRFSNFVNEHTWFGPVSAMMAKYCQFFNGSAPLGECSPNSSAAGAIKLDLDSESDIFNGPVWQPQTGAGTSPTHGDDNQVGHYVMRNNARFKVDARCVIEDIPDAHTYAGITFGFNCHTVRTGEFWNISPDTSGRDDIEVLPGVLSTIMREYHSDVRIAASKQ